MAASFYVALAFCSIIQTNHCGVMQVDKPYVKEALCQEAASKLDGDAKIQFDIIRTRNLTMPGPFLTKVVCLSKKQIEGVRKAFIVMNLKEQEKEHLLPPEPPESPDEGQGG